MAVGSGVCPGAFTGHLVRGQLAQFFVNERQQFLRGIGITLLDSVQNTGDFAHILCLPRRTLHDFKDISGNQAWLIKHTLPLLT